ncbi:MAG: CotH kinase family protein [Bacteroidales bacterium]|nr:CotH kinase family protein [Bacteroidales bacterium]
MKRIILATLQILCLLLPSWLVAQTNEVSFSPTGGVYAKAFPVTLTCDNPDLTIRYTLNGATPNGKSTLYSGPLMLSNDLKSRSNIYKIPISPKSEFYLPPSVTKGIVIRAAAFDSHGNRVSPVVTQSYFIKSLDCDIHGLPVVSICADSLPLFAHDTGILVPGDLLNPKDVAHSGNYLQHGREWERAVNVEFYADGNNGFNQMAGLRTHGGIGARRAQQKGLKLYARGEYGKKNFKYKIFEESELEKYKHLILRPFRNAATPSGINDWLANQIAATLNMGVTMSRPVTLFLNGEYWGIYFIEEKVDERYLESHYVVDCNNVNIISAGGQLDHGSADDYRALCEWLETAHLSDTSQYNQVAQKIDIPNFIDYYIFELFSTNWDWPGNNARCWQNPNGPWHWVFFDGDCCLDKLDYDVYMMATFTGIYWSSYPSATLFFRKLLGSKIFKNQFLLRLEELNNTCFRYQQTKPHLDRIHQLLKDEIPMQIQRFNHPQSVAQWEESCQKIDHYLSKRGEQFWQQTSDFFRLKDDKVSSVVSHPSRTSSGKNLKLIIGTDEDCTALMEISDPKGNIIHRQYVFLHPGGNKVFINLGKRPGIYVVKVGNVTCEITKTSYFIPILILVSAILIALLITFLFLRRKRSMLVILCLLSPTLLIAQSNEVQISPKGGAYTNAFPVSMTCPNSNLLIRYTLNGSTPNGNSALYTGPLMLNNRLKSHSDIYKILISPEDEFYLPDSVTKGIVIRAAAFDNNGKRVSPVVTQSYFVCSLGCNIHGLPVVSICADSLSLFAHDTGIFVPGDLFDPENVNLPGNYSQHGREWERRVNVEYYDPGNNGFNQTAGLRTHGGNITRRAQQKGLKIYARDDYGKKNFNFKIFEESEIDKFKHLVLRPFNNSCTPAGIQDWLSNHIAAPLNIGVTASRPVTLFLNGEYWGIYYLEEKVDERYLESHYGVDHDNVNIIAQWAELEAGSSDGFYSLYYWLMDADLKDSVQYSYFAEKIDIPNIIDYYLFELFSANRDWPINNVRFWQVPGGPWRWVFYDGDWCLTHADFDVYGNATYTGLFVWPTSEWSTLFFRKLLESEPFKKQFLERLEQLNRTCFNYKVTKPFYSQIRLLLNDEIPQQSQRFNNPQNLREWDRYCQYVDNFLAERVVRFQLMTERFFEIPDSMISIASIFPNPLKRGERLNLMVNSEKDGATWVIVYDINGKELYSQYMSLEQGTNYLTLDLGLPAGTYLVRVSSAKKKLVIIGH